MEHQWHIKSITEIFSLFGTNENGLDQKEAELRLRKYGQNKLPEAKLDSIAVIFLRQFQSSLIYLLLVACGIVFFMGETTDALIILFILVFNAVVGSIQEGRAQGTMSALKKFAETNATVMRDGKELILPDREVVPGDLVILQEGEKIPADARLIFTHNLKVDEAALTGESFPVHKNHEAKGDSNVPFIDQKNMVFKGTHVVAGNAKAVIVATGLRTVIGKISKEIATIETEIPLKVNIKNLSRLVVMVTLSIGTGLFFLGIVSGKPLREMFTTVVSLLVATIPEGLPIALTLVLTTGVWRMSKHNALVKKLQAVESLGQARIIAVDKTGTITKNELMVKKAFVDGKLFSVGGSGYEAQGAITLEEKKIDPLNHPELLLMGKVAAFCSNARVMFSEEQGRWLVAGDPTEAAMLVLSQKIGFTKDDLERESPEIAEIPFDYKTKYHATLHEFDGQKILALAGAPEVILSISTTIKRGGVVVPLEKEEKEKLEAVFIQMSEGGMRVVALAAGYNAKENISPERLGQVTFIGFLGMKDTLRQEARNSIQRAAHAGIKVVMITGDHKVTAQAIASEAGIFHLGDTVILGTEIEAMSPEELAKNLKQVSVFARVTPEHKIRIIQAYKKNGEIMAMTGDGVNDAPSLVAADLGIAMGKTGTEVTKEAADIVLLDDNFESIILAVEEGRNIYKTIKKVILYLFSTNIGEVLVIGGALFLGFPLPILPIQIIRLNFVTDGFLDVSLAMEPKEKGLINRKFEKPKKYLIDKLMAWRMFFMSLAMMVGTLIIFSMYIGSGIQKAQTVALVTLAVFQWFNAFNCRSEEKSIFQVNPFSNIFLLASTGIIIALQLLAVYHPVFQQILKTTAISLYDWVIVLSFALLIIIVEELRKVFYRRKILLSEVEVPAASPRGTPL